MTAHDVPHLAVRWSSDDPVDRLEVDNPATGEVIATVQGAGVEQVDQAVRVAHEAHVAWSRRPPRERGRALRRIGQLVRDHADELAEMECREMGKPVSQARGTDVEACITLFEYFGGLIESMPSQVRDQGYAIDMTTIEPYGVVAGVIPFNWPPLHLAGKAAPALAVGNGVVLKPPETAPMSILRIAELAQSVLPDDVLHIVPGGPAIGQALVEHPSVGMVTFTGSTATGRTVAHAAADKLIPALLELGGKNPILVFEDADLDEALVGCIEGGFVNQGEACTASSRILVQRSVHDEFVERLAAAVARLRVGDGLEDATHVGPMITRRHQQKVLDYLELGVAEGAVIAAQAPVPEDPHLQAGYFVPPTMFVDVTPDMRVSQEEIFGPVICVVPFEDEEEALKIANGTDYGLIAGVYSRDMERIMRVSRSIEVGIVFVNTFNRVFLGTPFGGAKQSGYGRVHWPDTLREFGRTKSVRLPSGVSPIPRWAAIGDLVP